MIWFHQEYPTLSLSITAVSVPFQEFRLALFLNKIRRIVSVRGKISPFNSWKAQSSYKTMNKASLYLCEFWNRGNSTSLFFHFFSMYFPFLKVRTLNFPWLFQYSAHIEDCKRQSDQTRDVYMVSGMQSTRCFKEYSWARSLEYQHSVMQE